VEGQRDAALFGTVGLAGPPLALVLTGAIRVDDGFVPIPQFGGPGADLTDITRPPPVIGQPIEPVPTTACPAEPADRGLHVTAGDGAWFIADGRTGAAFRHARHQQGGNATPIVGTLEGTRGSTS
jgi:hypothetical protein